LKEAKQHSLTHARAEAPAAIKKEFS
jgi:hypothetical protein